MSSPAPACRALLQQATARWPDRNKAGDGIMGDSSHKARKSDHNMGNAVDLTHDPAHGVDCNELAAYIVARAKAGIEVRAKYVIWNRRIASAEKGWAWRRYSGTNPHDHHMHVSIYDHRRNGQGAWLPPVESRRQSLKPTPTVEDDDMPLSDEDVQKVAKAAAALVRKDIATLLRGDATHPYSIEAIAKAVGVKAKP